MSNFNDGFIVILEQGMEFIFDYNPFIVMSQPLINFFKSYLGEDLMDMGDRKAYGLVDLNRDPNSQYESIRELITKAEEILSKVEVRGMF